MIRLGGRINPERLWMHYMLALVLIGGLLGAILVINQTIVAKQRQAVAIIATSEKLGTLSQKLIMRATDAATPADLSGVSEIAGRLRATNYQLVRGPLWSEALEKHYFGETAPLDPQLRHFINLAAHFANGGHSERQPILAQLKEIHGDQGLFDQLQETVVLIQDAAEAEAQRLQSILTRLSIIAGMTLLGEALLIFWPAHRIVREAIQELRRQADTQRSTQAQLLRMNDKLHHIANHDALTGLPNRARMSSFLTECLSNDQIDDMGILLIGLDDFKSLNEAIGHDQADYLLTLVAEALQSCVDDDDLVARIGGDEFFLTTTEQADVLVKRVTGILAEPFWIEGRKVNISASIGYFSIYDKSLSADDVLGNVAFALQTAKGKGGHCAVAFSQELRAEFAAMQDLQMELQDALGAGQIEPWFQPQINLNDGTLRGAEVLARWRHPTRGLLTPDKFLPAAERAGLIVDMDHAIWSSAINLAESWQQSGLWYPKISLNAAPDTISDPYLIERFLKRIHQTALCVDQVIVEVLEMTLIESANDMAAINIDSLAECGIDLELDDFGTGYASLSRLIQLPLAGLKLDRSLVAPLPDPNADSVVRAILALANELGLHVVAEGIEEDTHATHLRKSGCAIGQGYGFGRPMPADQFADWVKSYDKRLLPSPSDGTAAAMRA